MYQPIRKPTRPTYLSLENRQDDLTNSQNDWTPEQCARALWRIGDLSWKLWQQTLPIYNQIRELDALITLVVVLCARQFSKSVLCACYALENCIWYPNTTTLIVGPTQKQTIEIVAPRIKLLQAGMPPGFIKRAKSDKRWIVTTDYGESEIVIGGFDVDTGKQRGKTLKDILIEEIVDADSDKLEESIKSDLSPALTHSDNGKLIFFTTPPKLPEHYFWRSIVPEAELSKSLYSYTIYDNKALTPQQFVRCAKMAGCLLDSQGNIVHKSIDWLREYEVKKVRDTRITVLPSFDRAKHVKEIVVPPYAIMELTLDMGGVRDLTVAILHFYDYYRNKLCFVDERWFPNHTPTSKIVEECRKMEAWWAEEAQGGRIVVNRYADLPGQTRVDMDALGYETQSPAKDDWQANVNNLDNKLFTDYIEIDPKCVLTIVTFENGQFTENKTDFLRTKELGHCDAIATGMYANRVHCKDDPHKFAVSGGYEKLMETRGQSIATVAQEISASTKTVGQINTKGFGKFRR